MQGRFEEGREMAKEGLSHALEHNLTEAASDVYRRLASTLEYTSDYPGAREAYLTALNFCRNHHDDLHAQVCLGCMSFVFFQTGEWKRALETSREVIDSPESPPGSVAAAFAAMGLIGALRGESRQGRRHLQEALSRARRHEIAALEMLVLWGFATLEEAEGAEDSAGEHYRNLLRRWGQTQDRHDAIPGLCAASTFFGSRSAERETALSAQALGSIASATGNPEALAGLAYALGETALLHGKTDDAVGQFKAALDYLEKLEIPLARATTDYRLGVAYSLQEEKEKAIQHLSGAYRIMRRLGARPLAARLAEELEALGEPAEERRSTDSAARTGLTRRQKEIVRLLKAGLTNKEIARKLYLSSRTVDMHVSNILERLNSRTRTEAVRKASDLGLVPDTD
jgi:ATP/maltotriose-dependent transcriptional regulator MalT